ncbi:hypothetical protein Plhal304r1_c012g0047541 [Plasmopara halstedii]
MRLRLRIQHVNFTLKQINIMTRKRGRRYDDATTIRSVYCLENHSALNVHVTWA